MINRAQLWILRHGDALGPHGEDVTDPEDFVRPLSKTGVAQSIAAGRVLAKLADIDRCYTSPRVRTLQSAVLTCQAAGCGWSRDKKLERARKTYDPWAHVKEGGSTLLVGHSGTEAMLETLTGKSVAMAHGMLAQVKIRDGQCTLARLLSADDLKRLQ